MQNLLLRDFLEVATTAEGVQIYAEETPHTRALIPLNRGEVEKLYAWLGLWLVGGVSAPGNATFGGKIV